MGLKPEWLDPEWVLVLVLVVPVVVLVVLMVVLVVLVVVLGVLVVTWTRLLRA